MQALLLAVNLLCVVAGPHSRQLHTRQATNRTSDSLTLKTWWHASGEINTDSPVKDDNVRQSHLYSIEIATASSPDDFFNSFVYESIPRNGNGKICVPGDLQSLCDTDDQISIEPDLSVDMAWTQYLSSEDTIVRVSMLNGDAVANSGITIRPTNLRYSVSYVDGAALISVPSNPNGVRFSVEIQDNLVCMHPDWLDHHKQLTMRFVSGNTAVPPLVTRTMCRTRTPMGRLTSQVMMTACQYWDSNLGMP